MYAPLSDGPDMKKGNEDEKNISRKDDRPEGEFNGIYCNDFLFTIIYVAYVVLMITFATMYGPSAAEIEEDLTTNSTNSFFVNSYILSLTSLAPSLVWIALMRCAASFFINFALFVMIAASIGAAIGFTIKFQQLGYEYYWWPALAFGLLALFILIYTCVIQRAVKFASANLKVAISASFSRWGLFIAAIIITVIQFFLMASVVYGTYGISYHYQLTSGGEAGLWFASAFGIFWIYQTSRNVLAIATASTIHRWWKYPGQSAASFKAVIRASTSNLGSAALGSFFVAVVETLNMLISSMASLFAASENYFIACLFWILSCCISCLEYLLKLFNRFAFAFVGIHQVGFIRSGKRAIDFLTDRGCGAIVNDNLIENVLWVGSLITGVIVSAVGYILATNQNESDTFITSLTAFGFFIGYTISQILFGVISGATTTVYICFIDMPNDLKKYREAHYNTLEDVWREKYPSVFQEEREPLNP